MKGRQILIEPRDGGSGAAALMVDGRLEDLLIDPLDEDPTPRPEAIYRAVVGRPMKGAGGMIVELGAGATGFLRGSRPPAQGARFLAQVTGWAEPGKAPPVSARPTLKGRFAILTPGAPGLNVSRAVPEGPARDALAALAARAFAGAAIDLGLILRTLAAEAPPDAVADEIAALRAGWDAVVAVMADGPPARLLDAPDAATIARRDWTLDAAEPVETHPEALARAGIWETAAELLRPTVPLGAGSLVIEATRALISVDVNTGGDPSTAAGLQANLAAARELPRQLRLRGLGGQVVVDFAPLAKPDRLRVETMLRSALRRDGIETSLAGWTPLGHLELLRKRARRPLTQLPLR